MVIDAFLTIGLFSTVLIIFMIIKSSFKVSFKIWLSFIFVMVFIYLLLIFSKRNDLKLLFKLCYLTSNSISFIIAPAVLLFVKSLFKPNKIKPVNYLFHSLPFIGHLFLITIPFSSFTTPENLSGYLRFVYDHWSWFILYENAYLAAYLLSAYFIFRQRTGASNYDYAVKLTSNSLYWLKNVLLCFSFIVVVDLAVITYEMLFTSLGIGRTTVTTITTTISVIYLVLLALMNINFLESLGGTRQKRLAVNGYASRDVYFDLNNEEVETLKSRLNETMISQQLFLDEHLTLGKLANVLELKEKKLSFILNSIMHTNFYELINDYRLNFAIQKMKEEKFKNYSIHGIAIESGFKSKTTFYRAFKRKMKMTPKQYLESNK